MCSAPYTASDGFTGYDAANRGYVSDALNGDYKADGELNESSGLYLHTVDGKASACVQAGGSTSYSEALRQAKAELDRHGRDTAPDYIVFLTDGEANMGSVYGYNDATYPPGNTDDQQPCHTAINLANQYKADDVTIYSIGYALGNKNCTAGKWPIIPERDDHDRQRQEQEDGHHPRALLRSEQCGRERQLLPLAGDEGREPGDHVERGARADRLAGRFPQPAGLR